MGDINARARGLRTRLLAPSELERLARMKSLSTLQRALSELGFVPSDLPATPASLERAARRHAARQMRILDRWCGEDRGATLAVIFEEEDRRSIQAILRGAEQGAASEVRMAGLVPTRNLPERALEALCSQPTTADVVRMLVLWNHPFAPLLLGVATGSHPSLFAIEIELARAFAGRASARARFGGPQLVDYVQQVVDLMNAWSALLHFAERDPAIAALTFVEGGRWLTPDVFAELLGLDSFRDVKKRLAWELRRSGLARGFHQDIDDLADLESAVLRAQIDWQNRAVRMDPSGAAPLIGFAIELRAEVTNLQRIIWGIALRVPEALIEAELVVK